MNLQSYHPYLYFIEGFISSLVLQYVSFSDKEIHLFNGYDPPPIYEDIQVLHEVFII